MILVSEELGGLGYFFQCLLCFCGVLFVSAVSQLVMICAGAVYKSCKETNTRITRMLSVFPLPPNPSVDALSLWSLSGLYQFHFINSFLLQTLLRCRTKVKMKMRARVTRHPILSTVSFYRLCYVAGRRSRWRWGPEWRGIQRKEARAGAPKRNKPVNFHRQSPDTRKQ